MGKGKIISFHKYVTFEEVNLSYLLYIIKVQVFYFTLRNDTNSKIVYLVCEATS